MLIHLTLALAVFTVVSASELDYVLYASPEEKPIRVYSNWLYVGGWRTALPAELSANGITHVVSATRAPSVRVADVAYLSLDLEDVPTQQLGEALISVSRFIHEARSAMGPSGGGGKILVHCKQGVSRSVSLVLGYLITHQGLPFDLALSLVLAAHSTARPNVGFEAQLRALPVALVH